MEVRISPAWRRDLRLLASTCCCWLKWLPARAKSSLLRGPPRIRCANNVDAIYAVHRSREVTQSLRSLVWPPPKCRTSRDFQWCSSRIWAQASSRTMASGSSGASGSRSRRATSFSAGSGVRAWTALSTTSTFASSGTGRRPSICRQCPSQSACVHAGLRLVPGPRSCSLRRPARDRRVPGQRPVIRPGDRPLLHDLRRSE